MKIYKRRRSINNCFGYDGIKDICCDKFKEAYKNNHIIGDIEEHTIIFRGTENYDETLEDYKLSYCPFCGKKIEIVEYQITI